MEREIYLLILLGGAVLTGIAFLIAFKIQEIRDRKSGLQDNP
ncbi:MAG: hypothetical protein M0Z70_03580 [Nitrospiraceae bacterium]|nr:hypothetical protein [Nitrospiraceae bacterium]